MLVVLSTVLLLGAAVSYSVLSHNSTASAAGLFRGDVTHSSVYSSGKSAFTSPNPTSPGSSFSQRDLEIAKRALLKLPNAKVKYNPEKIVMINSEYCMAGQKKVACYNPKTKSYSLWIDFDTKPYFGPKWMP